MATAAASGPPSAPAPAPAPTTTTTTKTSASTTIVVLDPAEIRVGISAYLNDAAPGFAAVLKARYSDFLVHEVGVDGSVARLERMDPEIRAAVNSTSAGEEEPRTAAAEAAPATVPPLPEKEEGRRHEGEGAPGGSGAAADDGSGPSNKKQKVEGSADVKTPAVSAGEASSPSLDWDEIQAELEPMVEGEDSGRALVEFLTKARVNKEKDEPQFHVLPSMASKEARRTLHEWIRTRLGSVAVADTHDGRVRVWHKRYEHLLPNFNQHQRFSNPSLQGGRRDRPSRQGPEHGGTSAGRGPRYLRFVLYKENMDTNSAMRMVQAGSGGGDRRRKDHKSHGPRMGYAGMKDKRGVTCQFVTIQVDRVEAAPRIAEAMCRRWNGAARGDDMSGSAAGGGHTQAKGVGVVRVGDFSWVDRELQLGDLRGNRFDIVLRNLQGDPASAEAAATAFRDRGFINYFGMQRFGKYGDTHLVGIAVLRGDYESAIDLILRPKSDETPQYHEARVEWRDRFKGMTAGDDRRAVEKRCAERVVRKLGRFMMSEVSVLQSLARHPLEHKRAFSCISKTMRMMYLHAVQSYVWNHVASHRVKNMGWAVVSGDLIMVRDDASPTVTPQSVRVATVDDVSSGKYTLEDVMLPLIGCTAKNPENECSGEIDMILRDQGISLDMFHHLGDRDLDVSGDYRKLLCHPRDVDFELIRYNSPLQPLIQTDLMRIQGIGLEACQAEPGTTPCLSAIRIGFTLPPSSYATIAIRELMKRPSSSDYQSEQSLGGADQNPEVGSIS